MTGLEIDKKLRAALARLTGPEHSLSVAREIADLGFPAKTAWALVEAHLSTKA